MPPFSALVDYEDPYVQPLILSALEKLLPSESYTLINDLAGRISKDGSLLQFRAYEAIEFEKALKDDDKNLINAYIIRKALIRKHYLSNTIYTWTTKYPDSILKQHFKQSVGFEVDYAEFLDDALLEAYELHESFEKNQGREPSKQDWWILKPSMTDRGQGIRLFSTEEELAAIFEEWDPPESDEEDQTDEDGLRREAEQSDLRDYYANTDHITTSQLRDFVAQPYIHPPLLLPSFGDRKFHIRTYVLAVGALKVYVYKPMLALFAAQPYAPPWEQSDLKAHLTNTCLQDTGDREGAVHAFWDLDGNAPSIKSDNWKEDIFHQIRSVTGELFRAAAQNNAVHFQPLPNAFELFGLDYLVDCGGTAFLLEVNAFPDFKQTGEELRDLVAGLFEDVVDVAVKPFFGAEGGCVGGTERMSKVLDIDLGKR
jgi:tubulin--tyrosine ligase